MLSTRRGSQFRRFFASPVGPFDVNSTSARCSVAKERGRYTFADRSRRKEGAPAATVKRELLLPPPPSPPPRAIVRAGPELID